MDKSIPEWQRRFRGMEPEQIRNAWATKAAHDHSWTEEANFHAAAADRMKQLGNLAIDLDDQTRLKLCLQAEDIIEKLQRHLQEKPDELRELQETVRDSDSYYAKFGTRTARYYMFEQGIIDELGDRKKLG